jgi:hypothetical protein
MRVYLDSSVLQYLKLKEAKDLYDAIMKDSLSTVYCFSEAHIYDLVRDKTDQKFSDMSFMETIVKDNCWFYKEKIRFEYLTPFAYYNMFDWTGTTDGSLNDTSYFELIKPIWEAIEIPWNDILKEVDLPDDYPGGFGKVLVKSTNMYEFLQLFLGFTNELTNEQNEFKKLLQYLHKHSIVSKIYERFGIKGFDGERVIDKKLFRESFQEFCMRDGKPKYRYALFMEMFQSLELLGIVKGKPKKQGLMNLINDGRHAFFGAFCDLVVARDTDFLNKTKFLYDLHELGTRVVTISEFECYLKDQKDYSEKLEDLFAAISDPDILNTVYEEHNDEKLFIVKNLPRLYFGFFDQISVVKQKDGVSYNYFSKKSSNFSSGVLASEVEYVVNKLVDELGPDVNGRGFFFRGEILEDKCCVREWLVDDLGIQVNIDGRMYLAFFYGKLRNGS